MSLVLIATFTTEGEFPQEFLSILEEAVVESRKEAGCLEYKLLGDVEVPGVTKKRQNTYTILEHWKSPEDLAKHSKEAHTVKIFSSLSKFNVNADLKSLQEHSVKQ